ETRKIKRSSTPPRRRFRDVPRSPQFQVRQASQLSGEGARRERGKRALFSRRESRSQISSGKSGSQFVRHGDRTGIAPVKRGTGASGWNTPTRQVGRVTRICSNRKNHRRTGSKRFESRSLRHQRSADLRVDRRRRREIDFASAVFHSGNLTKDFGD